MPINFFLSLKDKYENRIVNKILFSNIDRACVKISNKDIKTIISAYSY